MPGPLSAGDLHNEGGSVLAFSVLADLRAHCCQETLFCYFKCQAAKIASACPVFASFLTKICRSSLPRAVNQLTSSAMPGLLLLFVGLSLALPPFAPAQLTAVS